MFILPLVGACICTPHQPQVCTYVSPFSSPQCSCTPASSTLIYANDLTSIPTHDFSIQYSYDKPPLDPSYISANASGLTLSLYPTDKPHAVTSNTLARTELLYHKYLLENTTYSYSIDQYIEKYDATYQFCFMQLFGASGPNILLRWRNGAYELVTRGGNLRAPSTYVPVVGSWRNWRLIFNLNNFIHVYLDGNLIISYTGASSAGGSFRPKFGIYSQVVPSAQATMVYRQLILARIL